MSPARAALLLLCASLLGCPASPPAAAPASAPAAAARQPTRVELVTAAGARHLVTVEEALTPEAQARGLMFRQELAEDAGMLFVFPTSGPRSFWMKNTLIPLDMIFVDEAGVVVGIVREAPPLTLEPRGPGVESRYVLEVRGGWAARHGVEPGTRLRILRGGG
jgi:uncharacterized membrane protein (UPF0127 family)